MDNTNWLLVSLGLCCVLPFIALLLLSLWAIQNAPRLIQPDTAQLQQRFNHLKAANASLSDDDLVTRIINRQALRSGIIGAITSVGGLPLLPIGLAIDLYSSARIQTDTLHFIAQVYSQKGKPQRVLKLDEALALRVGQTSTDLLVQGGQRVSGYLARRITLMVVEKTIVKVIPGIGLIIGFAVNYAITQGMMRLAARWYAGQRNKSS